MLFTAPSAGVAFVFSRLQKNTASRSMIPVPMTLQNLSSIIVEEGKRHAS